MNKTELDARLRENIRDDKVGEKKLYVWNFDSGAPKAIPCCILGHAMSHVLSERDFQNWVSLGSDEMNDRISQELKIEQAAVSVIANRNDNFQHYAALNKLISTSGLEW